LGLNRRGSFIFMKNLPWPRLRAAFLALVLFAPLSPAAHAYIVTPASDPNSQTTYESLASKTDLLTGITPTFTQQSDFVTGFAFSVNGINDGVASPGPDGDNDTYYQGSSPFSSTSSLNAKPTVTFTFDTSVNTLGYNIDSLQSIYGWDDNNSFSDQDYTITYTLVGSSSTFTLGNVAFNPFDPGNPNDVSGGGATSSLVTLSDIGLTGVSSISFEFTPYTSPNTGKEQGAQLIQEIDVFGEATPIPEPRTWAMLLGGVLFMAVLTRRRFRA
jgi:hypothetical protein